MGEIKDGIALTYIIDGVMYPCALTEEQQTMLTIMVAGVCQPLHVIKEYPIGKAVNLAEVKKNGTDL